MPHAAKPPRRHAIFTVGKKFPLGTAPAICSVNSIPVMIATLKHHRSLAGTSFTKAVVAIGCSVMRPVVASQWNKQQQTGSGNQA